MKIYILEKSKSSSVLNEKTTWDSIDNAYKYACNLVLDEIRTSWDLKDPTEIGVAIAIDKYIMVRDFERAINYYNTYNKLLDYSYQTFYTVNEHSVNNFSDTGKIINLNLTQVVSSDPGQFSNVSVPESFVATSPGACCRKCCISNEYVYADKEDGTYLCRQCKSFLDIFN